VDSLWLSIQATFSVTDPFPSISILTAGWRDLRAVNRLEHSCFGDDAWPLLDVLGVLLVPGIVRYKALAGDDIAGFVAGEMREGAGWITTLGVDPQYRRRGIARTLLSTCEAALAAPRVRLCVRTTNLAAQTLYLDSGYRKVDTWRRYYRGGEDAFVMEKGR
jgi:ribosomal-protein-alanine N-acetyltransferase